MDWPVEDRRLEDLTPYAENPRVITGRAVAEVARSIEEFGFQQPLVVTADGVIIAGHTRWRAARKLGLETVPCRVVDGLTDEQIRAFRIADNKTAEMTFFDFDRLDRQLKSLPGQAVPGFTVSEMDRRTRKLKFGFIAERRTDREAAAEEAAAEEAAAEEAATAAAAGPVEPPRPVESAASEPEAGPAAGPVEPAAGPEAGYEPEEVRTEVVDHFNVREFICPHCGHMNAVDVRKAKAGT